MRISNLVPGACAGCGQAGGVLCDSCRAWVESRAAPPTCTRLDGVLVALGPFDGPLRATVHALKFRDAHAVARVLASLLAARCRDLESIESASAVAPVPTSTRRRRRRGYDQAELLARALARQLDKPLLPLLARVNATGEAQTGRGATTRARQSRGAFLLDRSPPARLVLVDDVVTTGSTMLAALACVNAAGAEAACASVAVTALRHRPGSAIAAGTPGPGGNESAGRPKTGRRPLW